MSWKLNSTTLLPSRSLKGLIKRIWFTLSIYWTLESQLSLVLALVRWMQVGLSAHTSQHSCLNVLTDLLSLWFDLVISFLISKMNCSLFIPLYQFYSTWFASVKALGSCMMPNFYLWSFNSCSRLPVQHLGMKWALCLASFRLVSYRNFFLFKSSTEASCMNF